MVRNPVVPRHLRPDYQWVFEGLSQNRGGELVAVFRHADVKGISDKPARLPDTREETLSTLLRFKATWQEEAATLFKLRPDFALVSGLKGKTIDAALKAFEALSSDHAQPLQMAASSESGPKLMNG